MESMKFKVKVANAKVPTKLHHVNADGSVAEHQGKVKELEKRGAKLAPVLSSFGLWFMGGKDPTKFGISYQAEEIVITPGEVKPLSSFSTKRPFEMASKTDVPTAEDDEEESKRAKVEEEDDGVAM